MLQAIKPAIPAGIPNGIRRLPLLLAAYARGENFDGITTARTTDLWLRDADGVYQKYGNGEVGIVNGDAVWSQPGATNKCTNYNANPTDTTNVSLSDTEGNAVLSVVDDSAALAAAGLENICSGGNAYKVDATGNSSSNCFLQFTGPAGNLNTHRMSAFVRGDNSAVRLISRGPGASGASGTITANQPYARINGPLNPGATGNIMAVEVPPGATAFAVLNQLEESAFVTSPIVTAGSAATINATEPRVPWPSGLVNDFVAATTINLSDTSVNSSRLFVASDGTADNRLDIFHSSSGRIQITLVRSSSTIINAKASATFPIVTDTDLRVKVLSSAQRGVRIFVGSSMVLSDTETGGISSATDEILLGNYLNLANPMLGTHRNVQVIKVAPNITDAEVLAL